MVNRLLFTRINNNINESAFVLFKSLENVSLTHRCLFNLIEKINNKSNLASNFAFARKMSGNQAAKSTKPLPVVMTGVQVEKFGDEKELKVKNDINLPIKDVLDM